MSTTCKKRAVVSYENMNPELAAAFKLKYPKGFSDYLPDLKEYPKPDGTSFEAVTIEIPDAIYLVKINIQKDNIDDLEKWLDEEQDSENAAVAEPQTAESEGGEDLPDDNISQYSSPEDDTQEA